MSQIGQENSVFFDKFYNGSVVGGSVLPNQAIPESRKNDRWRKNTLDSLELEALKQFNENLKFQDYYDMVSGKMVYSDITGKEQDILYKNMREFQKEVKELPSYLRHWDLMYPILSILTGERLLEENKFRFDTVDEVSTNEFIRSKTAKLMEYTQVKFQQEMEGIKLLLGYPTAPPEHQKQLDKKVQELFPMNIEKDFSKNWKTLAAQWAEKTWERDFERFRIKTLRYLEAKDFLLTGRAPRMYRISRRNYYPEHWSPRETFHSKEADLTNYQDAEFAGRIKYYTFSQILARFGHKFSQKVQEKIAKSIYGGVSSNSGGGNPSHLSSTYYRTETVPFKGWSSYVGSLNYQEATGQPTVWEEDLTTGVMRPGYLPKIFGTQSAYNNTQPLDVRNDFIPRTDTIPVLECFFRGFKKIGILTYRTKSGSLTTVEVDESLEREFLKEHEIKNLRSVSEEEYDLLSNSKKENTIIWKYIPIIYEGLKFNFSAQSSGQRDLYFIEELPYQIRGDKGRLEDLKLPIVGIIDEAPFEKIRAEQIQYNFYQNQNSQYLQKELGGFFAFDVTMFPTEFMGLSEKGKNSLVAFRNFVKNTGLMPLDASKHNMMERGGSQFNTMMYQNVTFTDQIQRNQQLSEKIKWQAYEKLGITQARIGTPSKYESVEGVQVGQTASFSQTANITHMLDEDERIKIETHVTIAQYAQLNNKDEGYLYTAGDDEIRYLHSIKDDKWFDLRMFSVRPLYNFKKKREVETIKQVLLQNNTLGHDAYALANIVLSDDYMQLMSAAREAREFMIQQQDKKAENDRIMLEKQLQSGREERGLDYKMHTEDNVTKVKVAELKSLGRTVDQSHSTEGTDVIIDRAENYKPQEIEMKREVEMSKIAQKAEQSAASLEAKAKEYDLKKRELDLKEREIDANKFIAIVNKN